MAGQKFIMSPRHWYSWQILSREAHVAPPWRCTPVYISDIQPLKTGKGILRIEFIAALHPGAAQRKKIDVRVLVHLPGALIGTWRENDGSEQICLFGVVDFAWLEQHCTMFWTRFPPSSVGHYWQEKPDAAAYLDCAFGSSEETILSGATETSFSIRAIPLPQRQTRIDLDRRYDAFDSYLIQRGCVPLEMENKWFIYFKENHLMMHRSWTGYCIFDVVFERHGDELHATHALVNRDAEQYVSTDDEEDKNLLFGVINAVLLNKNSFGE